MDVNVADVLKSIKADGQDVEAVKAIFKDTLVKKEQQDRADTLLKVYNKLNEKQRDLKKLGPDVVTFVLDAENKPVKQESYSKARLEEKNKAEQEVAKIEKAFTDALLNGNFDEAKKLA